MPLNKSVGNMYPWVQATHTALGGECSHKCSYCYVNVGFMNTPKPKRYCGSVQIIESEMREDLYKLGYGITVFKEHKNDLFAKNVSNELINRIIGHCIQFPKNTYVLQSKNPSRFSEHRKYPEKVIFGTTIETNRDIKESLSVAPPTIERMNAMCAPNMKDVTKFVTIEPVMDFDVDILAGWIAKINPKFLNLGADSKNHNLPEPTVDKIYMFADKLKEYGIELREKHNLSRLTK